VRPFYIDPAVLTLQAPPSELETLVMGVLDVYAFVREWRISPASIDGIIEAMFLDDMFPFPGKLAESFAAANIVHLGAKDVADIIYPLLDRIAALPDLLGLADVLVSDVTYDPDLPSAAGEHVNRLWSRLLDFLAVAVSHGQLLSSPLLTTRARATFGSLGVGGSLEFVELSASSEEASGEVYCPCSYAARFKVFDLLEDVLLQIDAGQLILNDQHVGAARLSIALRTFQLARTHNAASTWNDVPPFTLGPQFLSAMAALELQSQGLSEKLLRSCAEVLLGINPDKSHDIRRSESGGSPAIKMGHSMARRRDLDREYHLHYWSPTVAGVQFASVGPHRITTIPELSDC
jgi:hypothetical protein